MLAASLSRWCTMEKIAPPWWQAAGRQREVSLSRQSGYVREEANQTRGLSEAGILSRLVVQRPLH
jgi:hypothetical protein